MAETEKDAQNGAQVDAHKKLIVNLLYTRNI